MDNINIKGIIFDYGGTIDSRGVHWSIIIREGYEAAGLEVDMEEFRKAYVHAELELARTRHILPHHNFLELMTIKIRIELEALADAGVIAPEAVGEFTTPIARYCYDAARATIESARPTLEYLAGRYPMVLVSNFYGNINAVLADFHLSQYFKTVIESAVVGVRKPDPAIFRLGVDALGLSPEEVIVVGDSLKKDILPARSIGCHTAWLKGRGWTSDEDAATDPSIIASLSDLTKIL